MLPAFLISLLFNLLTTAYILSTYFHTNSREDTKIPQFFPQDNQDYQEPTLVSKYGDKMDRLEDRVEDEDTLTDEKRFDNMYLQDGYYNLPRSMYYWHSVFNIDLIMKNKVTRSGATTLFFLIVFGCIIFLRSSSI